jgi:hypothetical protein
MFRLVCLLACLAVSAMAHAADGEPFRVGTWKTAQTIQPFLYEWFSPGTRVDVRPFTNPGDQKAALLAGSLDMTGTTLALARVLALAPKVLLMDEPFAALDAFTRRHMHDLLRALHGSMEMSILFVTHDVAEAASLADTLLVMGGAGQGLLGTFSLDTPHPRARSDSLPIEERVHALLGIPTEAGSKMA